MLLTGDIANSGDPPEHALAAELMAPLPMPIHVVAGNHDLLGERPQFAVEAGGLRLVVCDTSITAATTARSTSAGFRSA